MAKEECELGEGMIMDPEREMRGRKHWLEKQPHVYMLRRKKNLFLALAVPESGGSARQQKVSA